MNRTFRKWLKQYPLGWKHILRCGDRQVFEVIDHRSGTESRGVFVLADQRQTVMEWLLDSGCSRDARSTSHAAAELDTF